MATVLWRATVTVHRYLGIAVGALMLMWFISGMVMIYVPYPQITPAQHLESLAPIPLKQCCAPGTIKLADDEPILFAQIETLAGAPVIRIRADGRPPVYAQLSDGAPVTIDTSKARVIAADAAPRLTGTNAAIGNAELIDRDQWTVAEDYEFDRPLYRFTFDDPAGTQAYISSSSGAVVLWTTASQRFWNWLGAVPHWLYFTQLRSNGPLWSKTIIWASIVGGFLTFVGLFLGITQFQPGARLSPYRGWFYWHHLAGLAFGVLTLTWVMSGTISMNPWGFLEGSGGGERQRVGAPLPWSTVRASLAAIDKSHLQGVVNLASAQQQGKLFWIARWADGQMMRLDGDGRPAPLTDADLVRTAQLLANGRQIQSQALLTGDDSYYYAAPGSERAMFPVYRVILADVEHTRYYIDPRSGALLGRMDSDRRAYRWLFDGLHRLDFLGWLRIRPLWDFVILLLLLGGVAVTGTGCYLGISRMRRDVLAVTRLLSRISTRTA
jgi:uncharacterized iron-regulated membrane protein